MIDIAIEAAKGGGEIAFKYFTTALDTSYKSDHSPVTRADKEAEQFIRDLVTQKFPDHGILGEEFSGTNPGVKYTWVSLVQNHF